MKNNTRTYRMPEGFNPYVSIDGIRGLSDAIHHMTLEGPLQDAELPHGVKASLDGLVELLRMHAHKLHDYFYEIENSTTIHLPMSDEDFEGTSISRRRNPHEIKEAAEIYLVQ